MNDYTGSSQLGWGCRDSGRNDDVSGTTAAHRRSRLTAYAETDICRLSGIGYEMTIRMNTRRSASKAAVKDEQSYKTLILIVSFV